MTGRPLGRASLPGRGEARLAGTLWTLCGWHAARPCGGGPGACLRGDPRGRRVRCPWGPRARGRTSVRPDPDPGTPRRVTCSRLGPGHTRPVARTMEEGEEGRRPPPPGLALRDAPHPGGRGHLSPVPGRPVNHRPAPRAPKRSRQGDARPRRRSARPPRGASPPDPGACGRRGLGSAVLAGPPHPLPSREHLPGENRCGHLR